MSKNTFLDVDDTILQKNLILPGNRDDAEFEDVVKQLNSKPFFIVQPSPGACIKTKSDSGEKVFINICMSDKIPAPEDISDARLFEILSDEVPAFVIPMSIGNERLEPDQKGALCPTYDVVINNTYYKKCQEKTNFWLFTISVVMEGISDKFNKVLKTEDYVILKNRKAMGKLQQHKIEDRAPRIQQPVQKTLIEEISTLSNSSHKENSELNVLQSAATKPGIKNSRLNYILLRYPIKGKPVQIIGLFNVPKGTLGKDITVLVHEDRIILEVSDTTVIYDVFLPYSIQTENTKSFLDKNLGVLRVDMPVESSKSSSKI